MPNCERHRSHAEAGGASAAARTGDLQVGGRRGVKVRFKAKIGTFLGGVVILVKSIKTAEEFSQDRSESVCLLIQSLHPSKRTFKG